MAVTKKRRHVHRLHADDQAPRAAHDRLQNHDDGEQKTATEEPLRDGEVAHALVINLDAQDDHEHEHADPQRQIDEQWRHGRPERVEGGTAPRSPPASGTS